MAELGEAHRSRKACRLCSSDPAVVSMPLVIESQNDSFL